MKTPKFIFFGTLLYTLITFPLAVVWHLGFFAELYAVIGYINKARPSFVLGFLSILLQGVILTYGYTLFKKKQTAFKNGLAYAGVAGLFFWTCHVISYAAKHEMNMMTTFFFLETVYLAIQFGIYGALIGKLEERV